MFSYYGSKCKIIKYYPVSIYDIIIEPFAGAAWYSTFYRDRKIILNEKYKIIYDIWEWLINEATPQIILNHSDFYVEDDIRKLNIKKQHKDLIGFCINRGSVSPKNIVQKWSCQSKINHDWASTVSFQLKRIAKLLPEIRHWSITYGDYKDIPNQEATWFIDPPYQYGGNLYIENKIDYNELKDWCLSRYGQVIVCENKKADWLPFKPLINITGQRNKTIEVIYTNK